MAVVAATSDISRLDPALLRPGRLDRRIFLGPPDRPARAAIFEELLSAMPLQRGRGEHGGDLGGLAESIEGDGVGDLGPREASRREGAPHGRVGPGGLESTRDYAAWLASETEGYSGARVTGVCREAAMAALREDMDAGVVAPRHFELALGCGRGKPAPGGVGSLRDPGPI